MNQNKKLEDEIKFKELLKDPIRLFGWIFPYFFIILLLLGIYYVGNLSTLSFNEQLVGAPDSINIKKEIPVKKGGAMPAVDLDLVKNPTPDFIAKGKELFNTNCKSCHGDNGMGDGPAAAMLNPKPRNFHAVDGWTNGRNVDQMYKTLQEGIPKNGMAAYEYMPKLDRFEIISYIRTFAQFPPVGDDQLINLDMNYQVSQSATVPSTIPVTLAQAKLEEENSVQNLQFLRFQKIVNTAQGSRGVDVLKNYSINLKKVFTSFSRLGVNQNFDNYVSVVTANPMNTGFKPAVVQLSKEDWKILYDYLKSSTM
ncbi:MAG: cytochrome c [Melioribacter sp.]|nr:cytochrome c [Melioribacter sp.]